MHLHVGGSGKRLAIPVHGLCQWRRSVPYPVPDRVAVHWTTALLFGDDPRTVLQQRIGQSLEMRAHCQR